MTAIKEGELLFDNRTPATAFQRLDHSQTWSRRRPSTSQSRAPPLPGRQSIQSRSKSLRWGISFRNPLQRSVHPLPLIWQIKVSYVPSSKEKSTLTRRRTSRGVRSCNRSSPPLRSPLTLKGINTSSNESTCCLLLVPKKDWKCHLFLFLLLLLVQDCGVEFVPEPLHHVRVGKLENSNQQSYSNQTYPYFHSKVNIYKKQSMKSLKAMWRYKT